MSSHPQSLSQSLDIVSTGDTRGACDKNEAKRRLSLSFTDYIWPSIPSADHSLSIVSSMRVARLYGSSSCVMMRVARLYGSYVLFRRVACCVLRAARLYGSSCLQVNALPSPPFQSRPRRRPRLYTSYRLQVIWLVFTPILCRPRSSTSW
jgi:hypothetical protein